MRFLNKFLFTLLASYIIAQGYCMPSAKRKRQAGEFLCGGSEFATNLLRQIIDGNRAELQERGSVSIGGSVNLGLLTLTNGTLFGIHNAFIPYPVEVNCKNEDWAYLTLPLVIPNIQAVMDWKLPADAVTGKVEIKFKIFAANIFASVPRNENAGSKTMVTAIRIWATEGSQIRFKGLDPATSLMSVGLTLLSRLTPVVIIQFFQVLLKQLVQQYLQNSDLPI